MRKTVFAVLLISTNYFLNAASATISISPYIAIVDNGGGGGPTAPDQIKAPCWYHGVKC